MTQLANYDSARIHKAFAAFVRHTRFRAAMSGPIVDELAASESLEDINLAW